MAKINTIIPQQNFELIRDRIGEILADEISNQYALTSSTDTVPVIWISRCVPFDKEELPAINISLARIDYSSKDARSVEGLDNFNVDVYASSPNKAGGNGDKLASIKVQKIVGLCRSILENPIYRTLGYAPPFNGQVYVNSVVCPDPENVPDLLNTIVARLEFIVRCQEGISLIEAPLLVASSASVKIAESEKGYFYQYDSSLRIFTNQFTTQFS